MPSRLSTQIVFFIGVAGASVVGVLGGCTHMSQQGLASALPSLDEPSNFYRLASSGARSMTVYETRTVSFALDRIDQRGLPLDQTYRHPATGKGVKSYV